MGRRISKEFLHPSILEGVDNKIGNLDNLETDAKDNMVQAINELADKIDTEIAEGKELIANAVGEPLTAEESFDEMSNDINGLLSTFKTNMMNNGITVESGDKFKALIDKIATMVEEGEGKGIQFAEGVLDDIELGYGKGETTEENFSRVIVQELDFVPTFVAMRMDVSSGGYSNTIAIDSDKDGVWNWKPNPSGSNLFIFSFNEFIDKKFELNVGTGLDYDSTATNVNYYAIGVGEEDTTLRDSLASILTEEGVDVTEEDDMASLITKVDEKFNNDLVPTVIIDDTACLLSYPMNSKGYGEYYPDTPAFEYMCFFNGSVRFKADIMCSGNNEYYEFTYRLTVIDKLGNYIYDTTDVLNETSVNYLSHDLSNITSGSRIQLFLLSSDGQMHGWAHPYNIHIYGKTI